MKSFPICALYSSEQELTLRSVTDVEQFPLLESFHWEILRMFPAPPFYVKVKEGKGLVNWIALEVRKLL